MGVRVHLDGNLAADRPLLIVANHISWLDIPVLSTVAPLSFVAKAEMASWPLFGWMAKMQRTVFVARDERRRAGIQAGEIAARLAALETIVLFPEGTTGDANALLPFKTPLFEAAKIALAETGLDHAHIQPVALHYSRLHGLPIGRADRPHVAWPGEIGLAESLLPIVRAGGLDVVLRFCEPLRVDRDLDRKAVATMARAAIRAKLATGPAARHPLDSAP